MQSEFNRKVISQQNTSLNTAKNQQNNLFTSSYFCNNNNQKNQLLSNSSLTGGNLQDASTRLSRIILGGSQSTKHINNSRSQANASRNTFNQNLVNNNQLVKDSHFNLNSSEASTTYMNQPTGVNHNQLTYDGKEQRSQQQIKQKAELPHKHAYMHDSDEDKNPQMLLSYERQEDQSTKMTTKFFNSIQKQAWRPQSSKPVPSFYQQRSHRNNGLGDKAPMHFKLCKNSRGQGQHYGDTFGENKKPVDVLSISSEGVKGLKEEEEQLQEMSNSKMLQHFSQLEQEEEHKTNQDQLPSEDKFERSKQLFYQYKDQRENLVRKEMESIEKSHFHLQSNDYAISKEKLRRNQTPKVAKTQFYNFDDNNINRDDLSSRFNIPSQSNIILESFQNQDQVKAMHERPIEFVVTIKDLRSQIEKKRKKSAAKKKKHVLYNLHKISQIDQDRIDKLKKAIEQKNIRIISKQNSDRQLILHNQLLGLKQESDICVQINSNSPKKLLKEHLKQLDFLVNSARSPKSQPKSFLNPKNVDAIYKHALKAPIIIPSTNPQTGSEFMKESSVQNSDPYSQQAVPKHILIETKQNTAQTLYINNQPSKNASETNLLEQEEYCGQQNEDKLAIQASKEQSQHRQEQLQVQDSNLQHPKAQTKCEEHQEQTSQSIFKDQEQEDQNQSNQDSSHHYYDDQHLSQQQDNQSSQNQDDHSEQDLQQNEQEVNYQQINLPQNQPVLTGGSTFRPQEQAQIQTENDQQHFIQNQEVQPLMFQVESNGTGNFAVQNSHYLNLQQNQNPETQEATLALIQTPQHQLSQLPTSAVPSQHVQRQGETSCTQSLANYLIHPVTTNNCSSHHQLEQEVRDSQPENPFTFLPSGHTSSAAKDLHQHQTYTQHELAEQQRVILLHQQAEQLQIQKLRQIQAKHSNFSLQIADSEVRQNEEQEQEELKQNESSQMHPNQYSRAQTGSQEDREDNLELGSKSDIEQIKTQFHSQQLHAQSQALSTTKQTIFKQVDDQRIQIHNAQLVQLSQEEQMVEHANQVNQDYEIKDEDINKNLKGEECLFKIKDQDDHQQAFPSLPTFSKNVTIQKSSDMNLVQNSQPSNMQQVCIINSTDTEIAQNKSGIVGQIALPKFYENNLQVRGTNTSHLRTENSSALHIVMIDDETYSRLQNQRQKTSSKDSNNQKQTQKQNFGTDNSQAQSEDGEFKQISRLTSGALQKADISKISPINRGVSTEFMKSQLKSLEQSNKNIADQSGDHCQILIFPENANSLSQSFVAAFPQNNLQSIKNTLSHSKKNTISIHNNQLDRNTHANGSSISKSNNQQKTTIKEVIVDPTTEESQLVMHPEPQNLFLINENTAQYN